VYRCMAYRHKVECKNRCRTCFSEKSHQVARGPFSNSNRLLIWQISATVMLKFYLNGWSHLNIF
jgi:hypothetical protein